MYGIKNCIIAKDDFYFLIFYDIDRKLEYFELEKIDRKFKGYNISYMIYETLNGTHVIGLSPLDVISWAILYDWFKSNFHSYYSGQVIRIRLKEGETQKLLRRELNYGEVVPNLSNIWASRFNYEMFPWSRETTKYVIMFEAYKTNKQEKLREIEQVKSMSIPRDERWELLRKLGDNE